MERGYFRRVGTFVAWLMLIICAGLSVLAALGKLFHAHSNGEDNEDVRISEQDMKSHLHLCDCPDENTHTDINRHSSWCRYWNWFKSVSDDLNTKGDSDL